MPVIVVLTGFFFVLLLLGGVLGKGYGSAFSSLRALGQTRGMAERDIARLTGRVVLVCAAFFLAAALLFAFLEGGLRLAGQVLLIGAMLALAAAMLTGKLASRYDD